MSALKTLFDFTWIYWRSAYAGFTDKLLGLLPLMAYFENDKSDEELQTKAHASFIDRLVDQFIISRIN